MDQLAQLGIDPVRVLIYLLNTGILLVLLTYFFYRPMIAYIDKRRKQIKDSIDEAAHLKAAFEKKLEESEAKKAQAEAELKSELDQLRRFVDQKRTEMVSEMEAARAQMLQKAQAEIDAKKVAMVSEVEDDLRALMTRIVLHIVENKVPEEVVQSSIESAWTQFSK